jgi:nucleoid DNA-binding protein
MSKDELVRLIYNSVNENMSGGSFTLKAASEVYDNIFSGIKESLYDGSEVRIPSFGRFYVNQVSGRTIPHPKVPGQMVEVPPSRQIRFKVFPKMKDVLNDRDR